MNWRELTRSCLPVPVADLQIDDWGPEDRHHGMSMDEDAAFDTANLATEPESASH